MAQAGGGLAAAAPPRLVRRGVRARLSRALREAGASGTEGAAAEVEAAIHARAPALGGYLEAAAEARETLAAGWWRQALAGAAGTRGALRSPSHTAGAAGTTGAGQTPAAEWAAEAWRAERAAALDGFGGVEEMRRGYRQLIYRILVGTLLARHAPAAPPMAPAGALLHACDVEVGCYNETIRRCRASPAAPQRNWQSEAFTDAYSERCRPVLAALDGASLVNREYATDLLDRLLAGGVTGQQVGAMSAAALCPAAMAEERRVIELRQSQNIRWAVSSRYRCPVCKSYKARVDNRQERAADEMTTVKCICMVCDHKFDP